MSECDPRRFSRRRVMIGVGCALGVGLFLMYVLPSLLFAVVIFSQRTASVEAQRVSSPDSRLDAVVVKREPGFSIEPDTYRLYLTRAGSRALGDPFLEATNLEGLRVHWAEPKLLELSYSKACITAFRNQWSSTKVENGNYVVEIRLKPPEGGARHPCL